PPCLSPFATLLAPLWIWRRGRGTEVELLHILLLGKLIARSGGDDPAKLHDVSILRILERNRRVLLDHEDRGSGLGIDAADDFENVLGEQRRETERGFVQQQYTRARH